MLPIVHHFNMIHQRNAEIQNKIQTRRQLREDADPFDLPDYLFVKLYRLDKNQAREIIDFLTTHLKPKTKREISVVTKVLTALRFYATGNYQRGIGEEHLSSVCQTTVHSIIKEVTNAMVEFIVPRFIKFPSTRLQRNRNKHEFMNQFGFPGCIGAIDGTHIALLKPHADIEFNFLNRKGKSNELYSF